MNTANHQENKELNEQQQLAETIRAACIQAALAGYEDAGMSGLCHEGAWECAIDAIRSLNINAILEQMEAASGNDTHGESGNSQ
jgi:hypothetical protein